MSQVVPRVDTVPEEYPAGWLVGQLPMGMCEDDLFVRFATIFERVAATLRAGADNIEYAADTSITTPGMLRYLGSWLGYDLLDPGQPELHQRRIVAALGAALPRRGTAYGLRLLLEALTGAPVHIIEPGGVHRAGASPRPGGEVVVQVANTGHLRPHEFEALVRDEVPAHLHVRVEVHPPRPPTGTAGNDRLDVGATGGDDAPAIGGDSDEEPA